VYFIRYYVVWYTEDSCKLHVFLSLPTHPLGLSVCARVYSSVHVFKDLLRPFPIERFSGPMRNCKTRRKTHEQAFEACADVFEGKALRNQHISSSKVMNPWRKTLWNQFTKKSTTSQSSNRYASLARRLLSSMTDNLTLLRNRMGMNRQSSFLGIANREHKLVKNKWITWRFAIG
jgi:hypothetical protein